jgi:putative PIN family toxin of toxin-antitoxin system
MIVVLDTNVWASALEFGGVPDRAVFRALTHDKLAISDFIQAEILRVLTHKFGRNAQELQAQLDELLIEALFVQVTGKIKGICRDAKDDAILETAWEAGAGLLVAGDKDVLTLREFRGIAIVSPAIYLKIL